MEDRKDYSLIKKVLDKYFDFLSKENKYALASITESIPMFMLDKTEEDDEGYSFWIPRKSTITNDDILDLESLYKHHLPESFRYFLQQRHFMELHLEQNVNFFSVLPNQLAAKFKAIINNFYWTLIDRNYLPFANYGDWGVLCFDATKKTSEYEYEVILLDHEDEYSTPQLYSENFLKMFEQFDRELDERIMSINEHRKNNA